MRRSVVVWVIWLLMWHGSGSHAQEQQVQVSITGPITIKATAQAASLSSGSTCQAGAGCSGAQDIQVPQTTTTIITAAGATIRAGETQGPSLHEYVYRNDFAGLRDKLKALDKKENHPALIGSLQSTDDKGLTIAHLLACVGRPEELSLVTQAVHSILSGLVPLGQQVFKRASLESLSFNASCTSCRSDRSQNEVIPHLRLELTNPRQTTFLYGNVTPLECAAAHGHTEAMKLLMLQGVHPGRVLLVAQHFGLENNLFEAVRQAKADRGLGVLLHPDMPDKLEAPMRKPRQRRTELKTKTKAKSGSSAKHKQAAGAAGATAPAAATCASCSATQQQQGQGSCGAQPPPLTMTPQPGLQRPGGAPNVIGTVSTAILGAAKGKDPHQDPSKPAGTPSHLSEVMDVTALWLLSIMLLFPAWSTLCLLWRKLLKRRAALHDCLVRTRRAVVAVAKPSKHSGTTAAAPAAASGGSGTSRAAAAEQAEAKASSSKPGGATPRQQRKPGPSIALPASSGTDPGATANSNKASLPSAGLFRAISAPEGSLRAHAGASSSSSGGRDGGQAAPAAGQVAGVRRQGSSAAMVASAAGAAPAGAELSPPPRQGSSPNLASAATPAAGSALKAPSAGAAAAGKQKRSKLGASVTFASAPTGSKDKEQEASKGSKQVPAAATSKAGSSSGSASGSSSSAAKVTRTGSGASDSSTASSPAPPAVKGVKGPQVLHRASKAGGSSSASPKAAAAASAGVYKTRSEASGLLAAANSKSAAKAAVEAAAASVAAASQATCSSPRTKPTSALSAALKPAAGPASHSGPPAADPAAAAGSSSSSSGRASAPRKGGAAGTTQQASRGSGAQSPSLQPAALSPTAAAAGSSSSSRFTGSAAAAAASAVRQAAASAAAAASLRRTASGGVVLSPRSPLKDLNDVLNRTRDQDRPHSTTGAAAAAAASSSRQVAASAPSSNAWTPAAAAARAARAAGSSSAKPHQADEPEGQEDTADEEGSSAQGVAAAAAEAAASSAGASADDSQATPESSSSNNTAAAGAASTAEAAAAPPGIYVDSFTAAAVAAGILPSPTAAAPAAEQRPGPAAAPKQGLLNAHDSSFDAADAAAATAYAAAVAALPSDADGEMGALSAADADALHAPELDPPVSLLPAGLLSRLDAAPGRPSSSGNGALLRSVSALEPKVVQDLADMVAAAIAQEVAHGTHPGAAAGGASHQAEDAGAGRVSDSGARVSEGGSGAGSSSNGGGAQLTGSQLVQLSLQEALTALTASKQPAEVSGAAVLPAVAEHSALTAGGAADPFSISSADLFADLAQKLKLPTHNSPQKPQQQQGAEQQQGWFGPAAVSAADVGAGVASNPMQLAAGGPVLVDPAGLMCNPPRLMGLQGGISMPVSTTALQAPPGLQLPPASGVSAMSIPAGPAGAALLTAQQLVMQQQLTMQQQQQHHPQMVAAQPMHQQQVLHPQQQQQQQLVVQQGQQMVAVGPGGAQQVQLVQMQPVRAAAGQQGPLIRLANGQIVQGQLISVPGQVGGMALIAAGPSGAPVIMAPGGVVMQQQVQVQHMAPQQQAVSAQRVFFPHTLVQGQQQPQVVYAAQQGQHMVQGQLQGGVMAIAPAAASPALPARQGMRSQLHPGQMAHHAAGASNLSSSPAQHVTLLQRPAGGPVVGSPAGGGAGGQQQKLAAQQASSSVSSSPKVTVLEAPAGPGSVPGPQASGSPMHQVLASGPKRHSDTGSRPHKGQAASVQSGSTGAAEPGSPAVAEAQSDLHPTESAQMAADLDELLQQANEELGFSCLPAAARSQASPAAAGVAASPSSTAALDCLQLPEGFTTQ